MSSFKKIDKGLLIAMEGIQDFPKEKALDIGCGLGENVYYIAKKFDTIAYDSNIYLKEMIEEKMKEREASFDFRLQNVIGREGLQLDFPKETFSLIYFGISIFNSKDQVKTFLKQAFSYLKKDGILHVDFATYEDKSINCDFVAYGCVQIEPGSFVHSCSDMECHELGLYGGSFWTEEEVQEMLEEELPSFEWVYKELVESNQKQEEEPELFRSFYKVTIRKM